eukprot:CAMPEP_0118950196 /NCGR_PEP_ID=MMETSP1169-20130426/50942_1 /TAXON_ID=36882 /ORGANISM="Pyramimonas obovata, Strain CCMP722" /LENGTH=230 /DNA_ID=CAMNT_0006896981 /DNA_START=64 /DNA_END=752 /DNA_ORIENTATION=-
MAYFYQKELPIPKLPGMDYRDPREPVKGRGHRLRYEQGIPGVFDETHQPESPSVFKSPYFNRPKAPQTQENRPAPRNAWGSAGDAQPEDPRFKRDLNSSAPASSHQLKPDFSASAPAAPKNDLNSTQRGKRGMNATSRGASSSNSKTFAEDRSKPAPINLERQPDCTRAAAADAARPFNAMHDKQLELVFDPWAPSSAIYGCHQDGFNERPKSAKKPTDLRPKTGPIGGG